MARWGRGRGATAAAAAAAATAIARRNYSRHAPAATDGKQLRRALRKFLLAAHPDILRSVDEKKAEENEQALQTLNAIVDAALGDDYGAGETKIASGKYVVEFWCLERGEEEEEEKEEEERIRRVSFAAKVPREERLRLPFAVKAVETLARRAGVEIEGGGQGGRRRREKQGREREKQGREQEKQGREHEHAGDPDDILAMMRKGMHMPPAATTEAALFQAIRNHQREELERGGSTLSCARGGAVYRAVHTFRARGGAQRRACASAIVTLPGFAVRCGAVRCCVTRCDVPCDVM